MNIIVKDKILIFNFKAFNVYIRNPLVMGGKFPSCLRRLLLVEKEGQGEIF
jgi:hypothetical protein